MVPESHRVVAFSVKRAKVQGLRSDGTHAPFAGPLQDSVTNMVSAWVQRAWDEVREQNSLLPPTSFLPQELQDRLCKQFHAITTVEKLSTVLADWPHLEQYKLQLFHFCQEALKGLGDLRKEAKERKQAVSEKKHEVAEHSVKVRIPPVTTPIQARTRKDGLGEDDLEDGAPPRKRRR
jgi:hypothetical protein